MKIEIAAEATEELVAAFARLIPQLSQSSPPPGAQQLAVLLAQKQLLTSVLTYHVVAGAVDAATVVGLTEATTLNGAKISIKVSGGSVFLNDTVKVTTTDIQACNGIIHVIDAVLLPPSAPSGEMPATGATTDGLALGAGVLLVGGAAALLISRRRTVTA